MSARGLRFFAAVAALALLVRDRKAHRPLAQMLLCPMLDDRNDMMTEKITQFLATSKTYFVAVGAAHLVGEHGVIAQLRAKHYTVEQL